MVNLSIIRDICKLRNITLIELSTKIDVKPHALQRMFRTNSTKINTLEKIARVLNIGMEIFFQDRWYHHYNFLIPAYLYDRDNSVHTLARRYLKISEMIPFYKDYYFFCIVRAIHNGFSPEYKCENKEFSGKVIKSDQELNLIKRIDKEIDLYKFPYSKLKLSYMIEIEGTSIFEGFYFPIFDINFLNICNLLEDQYLNEKNEPEILGYWNTWKSK